MKPSERMKLPRQDMPEQEAEKRNANFEEVNLGFEPDAAALEAVRCLQCKNAKCILGCPVGVDIPGFVTAAAEKVEGVPSVEVQHLRNPRRELDHRHFYEPVYTKLKDLGLKPHLLDHETLCGMLRYVAAQKDNIDEDKVYPTVDWARGG